MVHWLAIRVPLLDLELTRALAPLMQHKFRPDKKLMAQCALAKVVYRAVQRHLPIAMEQS